MAVELLIKAVSDYTDTDAAKDLSGIYKKGYIVVSKEIPHSGWGKEEGLPKFCRLIISDMANEDLEIYKAKTIQSKVDPNNMRDLEIVVQRREWMLNDTLVDDAVSYFKNNKGQSLTINKQYFNKNVKKVK